MIVEKSGKTYFQVRKNVFTQAAITDLIEPPEDIEIYISRPPLVDIVVRTNPPVTIRAGAIFETNSTDFWSAVRVFAEGISREIKKENDGVDSITIDLILGTMLVEKKGKKKELTINEGVGDGSETARRL